jgi:pimeloyl-ACP methyl ester carboxylesterase
VGRTWHGAKEALRQLTYWQMKNRAGTVGRKGLGPLLGRLQRVRVHLVGHSFGGRLVAYALAGMPAGPSPVKGVTLLQGAFSQWAFAESLPFDADRKGKLAGAMARIDGPLAVVHSRHDKAVGTFYPLASMAARDDSAGIGDAASRWGGIGANGIQGVQARQDAIRGAGPGNDYPFAQQQALNVDASDIVRTGGPPSGAHSDIVHPELTWIVLSGGRIVP